MKGFREITLNRPYLMKWFDLTCQNIYQSGMRNFDVEDLYDYIGYLTKGNLPDELIEWVQLLLAIQPYQIRDYLMIQYQVLDVPRLDDLNLDEL